MILLNDLCTLYHHLPIWIIIHHIYLLCSYIIPQDQTANNNFGSYILYPLLFDYSIVNVNQKLIIFNKILFTNKCALLLNT
jgi:hypothetical protein